MENLIFLIRSLGISGTYLGYYYLCTAVKLVLEDPGCLLMISKILYPKIALIHHTTPACVERDIRTVINLCWTRGGPGPPLPNRRLPPAAETNQWRIHRSAGYLLSEISV